MGCVLACLPSEPWPQAEGSGTIGGGRPTLAMPRLISTGRGSLSFSNRSRATNTLPFSRGPWLQVPPQGRQGGKKHAETAPLPKEQFQYIFSAAGVPRRETWNEVPGLDIRAGGRGCQTPSGPGAHPTPKQSRGPGNRFLTRKKKNGQKCKKNISPKRQKENFELSEVSGTPPPQGECRPPIGR